MNDKIKELAKMAREQVRSDWYKENEIQYPNAHYVFQMASTQKFAELIIQECMDNLFFHGYDDAANQLDWFRRNILE